ncbi:MAG: hypothetical protein Q4G58_09970 [bacterium]|nr:hypothetical protein [bacterium]
MEMYLRIIKLLEEYFKEDTKAMFLSGGCLFLAELLYNNISHSKIMINRCSEHCATEISCYGIYDITGRIGRKNFRCATARDLLYMKKNYIPKFDIEKLNQYLSTARGSKNDYYILCTTCGASSWMGRQSNQTTYERRRKGCDEGDGSIA